MRNGPSGPSLIDSDSEFQHAADGESGITPIPVSNHPTTGGTMHKNAATTKTMPAFLKPTPLSVVVIPLHPLKSMGGRQPQNATRRGRLILFRFDRDRTGGTAATNSGSEIACFGAHRLQAAKRRGRRWTISFAPFAASVGRSGCMPMSRRSVSRPRETRERTVPTGTPRTFAASS